MDNMDHRPNYKGGIHPPLKIFQAHGFVYESDCILRMNMLKSSPPVNVTVSDHRISSDLISQAKGGHVGIL